MVQDIRKYAGDAEILIVDSSSDKTPEIAESLGVKVIRQFPPKGYGRAMDLALRSAANDIVITLDCDNTYPAEEIPRLAQLIEEGYDIVDASRLKKGRPKNMPYANYLANWTFAATASLLHGKRVTDVHSGMRAYRKSMLSDLTFDPDGPALPVELLIKPIKRGYKFKEIGIDYKERLGETTLKRFSSTIWTFKRIFRLLGYK